MIVIMWWFFLKHDCSFQALYILIYSSW